VGEFERRLRQERRVVASALATTDAELTRLEGPDREEFADDAAREAACQVLTRLEARDRRILAEIEAAETRLAEGTFGTCEACGEPIPLPRLRALPTARLCVPCEAMAERPARLARLH
jgi:RNA polymerase-binding protein DksA